MINGSTAFNNAVNAGGYPYTARISYNGTVIDCVVSSCTVYKGSTGNESFGIASTFVPYIEMEVIGLTTSLSNKELKQVVSDSANVDKVGQSVTNQSNEQSVLSNQIGSEGQSQSE